MWMLYLSVVVQDGKKGKKKGGIFSRTEGSALSNVEFRKADAQSNVEVRRWKESKNANERSVER